MYEMIRKRSNFSVYGVRNRTVVVSYAHRYLCGLSQWERKKSCMIPDSRKKLSTRRSLNDSEGRTSRKKRDKTDSTIPIIPLEELASKTTTTTTAAPSNESSPSSTLSSPLHNDTCSTVTTSRERLTYKSHQDGLIHENTLSFDDVNFCFRCDLTTTTTTVKPTLTMGRRGSIASDSSCSSLNTERKCTNKLLRARSTSVIENEHTDTAKEIWNARPTEIKVTRNDEQQQQHDASKLTISIEKTGYKLQNSVQVPVYRKVFLCGMCLNHVRDAKTLDPNFTLRITASATSYFISSK